jgi:tetratricopeptide (TPR) repeat protein
MDGWIELLERTARALEDLASERALEPGRRRRLRDLLDVVSTRADRLLETLDSFEEAQLSPSRRKYRDELLEQGLAALARDQFETAKHHFEEGVEEFPDDLEFLNHLGLSCWEEGAYRDAAHWYGRAMEVGLGELEARAGNRCESPPGGYLRAMEGRALSLKRLGHTDDAASIFDALASMAPAEYAGCHYLAGEIHHERGELDRAIEAYERAPEEPAVLYNAALAEFELSRLESAATHLIRAFEANPRVATLLLETTPRESLSGCGGYVGSATYAEEVVESSASLWRETEGARTFLDRCFHHPLVSEYLEQNTTDDPPSPLQTSRSDTEDNDIHGLARYLVERMD